MWLLSITALSVNALASTPCGTITTRGVENDTIIIVSRTNGDCSSSGMVTIRKQPFPIADTSVAADDSTFTVINDSIVTTVRRGLVTTITKIHTAEKKYVDRLSGLGGEWYVGDTLVRMRDDGYRVVITKVYIPPIDWSVAADDSATIVTNDTLVTTTRRGTNIIIRKISITKNDTAKKRN